MAARRGPNGDLTGMDGPRLLQVIRTERAWLDGIPAHRERQRLAMKYAKDKDVPRNVIAEAAGVTPGAIKFAIEAVTEAS
jgi:enamine deaminase RidA (YjgF/YER057c/UK114 family)